MDGGGCLEEHDGEAERGIPVGNEVECGVRTRGGVAACAFMHVCISRKGDGHISSPSFPRMETGVCVYTRKQMHRIHVCDPPLFLPRARRD